jgi:TolB-like protein
MTFSSNSSGRATAGAALAALACLAGGCGGPARTTVPDAPPAAQARRVALLPPANLSGFPAPVRQVEQAMELALRSRGFDVVAGEAVRRSLVAHRIRQTAGIDEEGARVLREELGADAALVTTVQFHDPAFPPRMALDARLVATTEVPEILWEDGFARGGTDSPGLLNLGVIHSMEILEAAGVNGIADSLVASLQGGRPAFPACSRIRPSVIHRSRLLDDPSRRTIAVLPFVNQTERRNAADAVALEIVRELVATGRFRIVEPGRVRAEMLAKRIIVEGGASLDAARAMANGLGADILMAGYVREYADLANLSGPPRLELTVYAIDGRTGDVVWWSSSRSTGEDGVIFFGLGRVSTATALACGVGRGIAERMAGDRPGASNAKPAPALPGGASGEPEAQ